MKTHPYTKIEFHNKTGKLTVQGQDDSSWLNQYYWSTGDISGTVCHTKDANRRKKTFLLKIKKELTKEQLLLNKKFKLIDQHIK